MLTKLYKLVILLMLFNIAAIASGSDAEVPGAALKVYIDCDYCDFDYIRSEIRCVDYVRDRKEADIHVMITSQTTGSGGEEYTITFIGQLRFDAKNDTLLFTTRQDNTDDDVRKKMVNYLKIGLVPYVAKTPAAENLTISYSGSSEVMDTQDNWNYWVFRTDMYFDVGSQESQSDVNLTGSIAADRITENWKIRSDFFLEYDEEKYKINGKTITGVSRYKDLDAMVVRSLNRHWSTGMLAEVIQSSFSNQKLSLKVYPAIEYDIFPYNESTRRIFRLYYALGLEYNNYYQETIYDKKEEYLLREYFGSELEYKQPWGRIDLYTSFDNYLMDLKKNQLSFDTDVSVHLFKGFSFNVNANVSRIHNQISLPKGEATNEEILLEIRELETQYSYAFRVGFEYAFGSIYNNIVNPRFGN